MSEIEPQNKCKQQLDTSPPTKVLWRLLMHQLSFGVHCSCCSVLQGHTVETYRAFSATVQSHFRLLAWLEKVSNYGCLHNLLGC